MVTSPFLLKIVKTRFFITTQCYWVFILFGIFSILKNAEVNILICTSLLIGREGISDGCCMLKVSINQGFSLKLGSCLWFHLDYWLHPSLSPVSQVSLGLSAVCSGSVDHWDPGPTGQNSGGIFSEEGEVLRHSEEQKCPKGEGVPITHPLWTPRGRRWRGWALLSPFSPLKWKTSIFTSDPEPP